MNGLIASSPRYSLVGAGFALLNTALLIAFDHMGLHYALAVLLSALVLVPLSYWVHLHFTFRVDGSLASFVRYVAAQLINTPIAFTLIFFIHDLGELAMIWCAPLVMMLMFLYNLTSSYWAIAARRTSKGSES